MEHTGPLMARQRSGGGEGRRGVDGAEKVEEELAGGKGSDKHDRQRRDGRCPIEEKKKVQSRKANQVDSYGFLGLCTTRSKSAWRAKWRRQWNKTRGCLQDKGLGSAMGAIQAK